MSQLIKSASPVHVLAIVFKDDEQSAQSEVPTTRLSCKLLIENNFPRA